MFAKGIFMKRDSRTYLRYSLFLPRLFGQKGLPASSGQDARLKPVPAAQAVETDGVPADGMANPSTEIQRAQ